MAMAQNITFIPAVRTVGTQKPAEKKQKVRVAAYCRVSTDFEEQESSYETQVAHYTSYINGNPEWEMVEVYADNGLSGTRTAKREAFNRMIADCEAIIDRETFLLVQEEIARRSSLYKGGKKRMYSSKYALSGNVVCGHCGNIYRRVVWSVGNEKPVVWRCVSRLTTGQECSARTVPEEDLHAAIASAVNMAYGNRDDIIPVLKENIESVVGCDADEEIEVIDNMIRKSQMDLLDAGRDEARVQEIGERIVSLRERRQHVLTQAALRKDEIDRIKAMITFIEEQTGDAEYSEILVRRMVEKVTIHDDRITVEFKSGLAIDVDA